MLRFFILGVFASVLLQVRCGPVNADHYTSDVREVAQELDDSINELQRTIEDIESLPEITRSRRDLSGSDFENDACHTLQNHNLPTAREAIRGVWYNSTDFLLNITSAFNDIKNCPDWNVFHTVPCVLKAVMEFRNSFVTYKPQLISLIKQIHGATADSKSSFIGCVEILLKHQAK